MKNQYFGDQNDYVKYGLLRVLAKEFRIGVAWMLTPPDGNTDGKRTNYLRHPEDWRGYDHSLYDALRTSVSDAGRRDVRVAKDHKLIPSAIYFTDPISDVSVERAAYFARLAGAINKCDLVFFDPDNGMEVPSKPRGKNRKKGSSKYLYWDELTQIINAGKSALVYQHFPRKKRSEFLPHMRDKFAEKTGISIVHSLLTKHVAFFLLVQQKHSRTTVPLIESAVSRWDPHITLFEHCRPA